MTASSEEKLQERLSAIDRLVEELKTYYPKAVLLFGSLARYLAGDPGDHFPNDVDLLVVTDNPPIALERKYAQGFFQFNFFKAYQIVEIAKSLRYDSKAVALIKLYAKNLAKQHARDVIAACLLLGPSYRDFGIEQIEIDGLVDTRDYSVHRVLQGHAWWSRLRAYACQRRGPIKRFSDRIVYADRFSG
jgi:predicted nucleotidyltransferase